MKFTKQEYADLHLLYGEANVVIQERQGDYIVSVFLKESFRPILLLWRYICVYVRISDDGVPDPSIPFNPFGFLFLGPHERFGIYTHTHR
jgi:hypothetical protein